MSKLTSNRIMSGTWLEVWLDSEYVGEAYGIQAKMNFNKEDVPLCGQFATDTKTTSCKGTGSLKLYKVSSRMANVIGDKIRKGIDVRFTLISKLSDPDSRGSERIVYRNVSFDDLTLADWEVKNIGKVEVPFTFTDYEYLDKVVD